MLTLGVMSDLHFGSRACMVSAIGDCARWLAREGARVILIPGDILQGEDPKWRYEMSHHGLDDQARATLVGLPELEGIRYLAISGNHDHKYNEIVGVSAIKHVSRVFREGGRSDFRVVGEGAGRVVIGGVRVDMWHPVGGGGQYPAPALARRIRGYASDPNRPHILLAGHWHRFLHTEEQGVQAVSCPTFQAGDSFFGQRMATPPSMGGLLLRVKLKDSALVRFSIERWIP